MPTDIGANDNVLAVIYVSQDKDESIDRSFCPLERQSQDFFFHKNQEKKQKLIHNTS